MPRRKKAFKSWAKKAQIMNEVLHGRAEAKSRTSNYYQPKSLAALCKAVMKKHKITQPPKKDDTIRDFIVVGGKPLRKRKESTKIEQTQSTKPARTYKKRRASTDYTRPRGRPCKVQKHKDEDVSGSILSLNPEPVVSIKQEELDLSDDPLSQDDEYTVVIKEEHDASSETSELSHGFEVSVGNPKKSRSLVVAASEQNHAPSTSRSSSNFPLATIEMDEMQIFANSVAEQLRALPIQRALLLQVEIQTMIDNERQLAMHEY